MEVNSYIPVPVVSVVQMSDSWNIVTWSSNMTGLIDAQCYSDFNAAEVAAIRFAELNAIPYVFPKSNFVTIKPHQLEGKKIYIIVDMSLEGCKHVCNSAFTCLCHAFEHAENRANKRELAFAPLWYVGKAHQRILTLGTIDNDTIKIISPLDQKSSHDPDDRDLYLPD